MKLDVFLPFPSKSEKIIPPIPYYDDLSVHAEMICDKVRMNALEEAIKKTVSEKIVLDIGAGTLILSLLAVKYGAKKVYSIEVSPYLCSLYHKLLEANKMQEKVKTIQGFSTNVSLPERCDVLVSELIGHFGIDESIIPVFEDAKRRLLKPNAIVIPKSLSLYLMPVEISKFEEEITKLRDSYKVWQLSFQDIEEMLYRQSYLVEHPEEVDLVERVISKPKRLITFNLTEKNNINFNKSLEFEVQKNSKLNGFVGWFKANLIDGVSIYTSPKYKKTNWEQCFFPIKPINVRKGNKIRVEIKYEETNPLKIERKVEVC